MRMSHAHHEFESENVASPPPILATGEVHRVLDTTLQTAMHLGVYKIALACWVGLLAIFWVTFWVSDGVLNECQSHVVHDRVIFYRVSDFFGELT